MSTLAELTTPLTVTEARDAIYAALAAQGVTATTWKPGGTARTIVAGLAVVLSAFSRLTALIASGGFLELAEGDWLTLVALHVYGVERSLGTFATGEVTLTNGGGGVFAGAPGDLVFRHSSSGKTYRSTEAYSLGASPATTTVAVEAVELGSASTAVGGTITEFVTPLLGVTVSNASALIGTDAESDEALRIRCREKTGTLSPNGPRDAYSFVAKSAVSSEGIAIGVTRVLSVPDGVGGIDVYVADEDGTVTGDAEDPDTDLGAVADAIHRLAEPLGITPRVQSADALAVDVTYELWIRDTSGYTDAEVAALVEARLLAFLRSQPIGGEVIPAEVGRVYHDALEAVIGATLEAHLIDVVVTTPAADVDVAETEAPVLGTVTPMVHQIAGGTS